MRKVLQKYDESRRRTLLDSVSILSRQSVFGLLLVFLTAFSGSVWGANVNVSFASWNTGVSAYSDTEWTDNGCTFTYSNNNNKGWGYVRCGGKTTSATSTIKYNTKITVPIDSVVLSTPNKIANGTSSSITITGIEVAAYSDAGFSTLVSSKNLGTLSYTSSNCPTSIKIAPATAWDKDLYYKISISWTATGSKNCGLNISGITFYETASKEPTVSVEQSGSAITAVDFGDVEHDSEIEDYGYSAIQTINVKGSNLTDDVDLEITNAAGGVFSIWDPTKASPTQSSLTIKPTAGAIDTAVVIVAYTSAVAGEKAGELTVSSAKETPEFNAITIDLTANIVAPVAVSSVSVANAEVYDGGTVQMAATVLPNDATNKAVTWSSDDEEIATVDENGLVTAVAVGSTTITATSVSDNTKSGSATITVKEINTCAAAAQQALTVSGNNVAYFGGKEYTIRGYVTSTPSYNDQYKNVTFWMADTKAGGDVLQAYRAACATADDAPALGDLVEVTGSLTKYNTSPQFAQGCTFTIVPQPKVTVKNNASETIETMAFGNVGQRWQKSFVYGFSYENLEAGDLTMTIGGTNASAFAFYGGELTETVNISSAGSGSVSSLSFRQATDVAGEYSATLTISGCGLLEDVVIPITMTVKAPEFSVSPSVVHFGNVKQHMKTTETFTLTGKYLSGDYSVVISAYGSVFDVLAENETYYIWPDENKEINETVTVICNAENNVDPNTYESHMSLASTSLVKEFADIDNLIDFDATVVATYPVRFQVYDNDRGTITINGEEADAGGKITVYVVDDNEQITMEASPKLGYKFSEWQVANADKSKVEIDEPEDASTYALVSAEPEDYITAMFVTDCTPLDRPSNAGYVTKTYNSANLRWQWVWEDENKAATYHIHAFETENPSEEIDVDIELTSSEMEESNVYRTLTGLKGSTDYTIQIWGTSTTDGFCETGHVAEFELTTNAYPNATLTLSENGVTRSWGENLKVASVIALPSAPAVSLYGKTFVGWTNEANKDYSHATAAPAVLYAPGANYTVAAEADKLYAVYATATPGETVQQVIKHSVSSNTNLTEDENAATTFGLDAEQWTILGAKGGNSNNVGLNSTSKDIRLYYHSDGGNTLTITAPKTIVSASIALTENYTNAWVKVGGKAVVAVDGVYPINAKTFVIGNANTSNVQVRFTQVTVNLAGDPTYSAYATTGTHIIEWSAETGKAYTVIKDAVLPTLSNPESVEVTYSSTDETVATIDASTGAISPLKAGTTTIKATYQTVVVSYTLTVYEPKSIALGGELTKTAYEYGDAFDCSGLTATLTFGDEATADVTSLATWLIDDQASATVYDDAQFGVEVSYAELNDSESYDVTVNKHAVTFANPEHGTLVVKKNNGLGWVAITSGDAFVKGTTLKVEANADEDYKIASIYAGEENITESKTFTVGTVAVEVSANTASYPAANISWASAEPLVLSLSEASSPSNWRLLNNPGYFTVEVTSSNTDVIATMSKSGNYYYAAEVLSTGTTTITATFAGNDNFRETSVSYEVTIEKDDAGLAWSGVDGSNRAWAYMQGKDFLLPSLTYPNGLDVTYSCADGEGIITINETTGAIQLLSEGAVHITATSAATDTYKAGTANYTLYVCGVNMITLSGDAEKKTYEYGDAFDRTGLTVTATYNNGGGTSDVTELVAWTYDKETITAGGSVHVTVNYANQTDDKYVYDIKVATHAVTWSSPEHGSLEVLDNTSNPFASGTKFRKGIEITVVPSAGAGYELATLTANGVDIKSTKKFTIDTEDVAIVATFTPSTPTAIDNAEAEVKVVKFIENGQIFIQRGSKVYTIDGQLVK